MISIPWSFRRVWYRTLVGLTACIVFCGTGEATSRVYDKVRYGVPFLAMPSRDALIYRDSLTVRGTPNARSGPFTLDRFGFQAPDMDSLPAPGCTRVMALGASETFGYTESPGKNYVTQLRDSLGHADCYDVINAGVRGLTGPNLIRFWDYWASAFRPKIVVIYPTPNFYLDNSPPAPLRPAHPQGSDDMALRSRFLDHAHDRFSLPTFLQQWRLRHEIAEATADRPRDWFFNTAPQDRLELFRKDLDSLVTLVQASGATPVLVATATRFGASLTARDQELLLQWRFTMPRATPGAIIQFERQAAHTIRQIAASHQIPIVDADSAMTGHGNDFSDAQHFTDAGAGVLASLVAPVIREFRRSSSP